MAISGLQYIYEEKERNPDAPMVVNLSLGGPISSFLDDYVQRLIDLGVVVVVAAGNSNSDACDSSPARVPDAITVGATTRTDRRASFSSFGSCVDIFAPGDVIESLWPIRNNTYTALSGTSMAAPYVAGAAALYLQNNPKLSPQGVWQAMLNDAVEGVVQNPRGANYLLNTRTLVDRQQRADASVPTAPTAPRTPRPTPPRTPAPTPSPQPQCRGFFAGCSNSGMCCSGGCRLGVCWFW